MAAASLHLVGCSQGGRSPSARPETGSALRVGLDAQLVRDYVAAVDAGDIRAAMALRCTAARIKSSDEQLFATQVSQLRDNLGPISVASVKAADPVGLEPSQDGDHPRQMLVRFSYGGRTAERSLRLIAVDENHQRRLCGVLADPPIAPQDLPAPRNLGSTKAAPDQMLPTAGPAGWSQERDTERKLKHGEVASASRVWRPTSFGGARVTVVQFETAQTAAAEASEWVTRPAKEMVETFPVPDVPGAVGIRYLGHAWTWVQAPSEAPFIDTVVLRGGDRAAAADVTISGPEENHDLALALATEIAERAHFH